MPWFTDIRHRLARRPDGPTDLSKPEPNGRVGRGPALNMIEPKPLRAEGARAAQPLPDETLITIQRIAAHMDTQSERAERLLVMLDRMPQAVEIAPELNRQTGRLLEMMTERLAQSREREQAINDLLGSIHEGIDGHQTQFLRMAEALDRCEQAMSTVAMSNDRSAALLARLVDSSESRTDRLEAIARSGRRWMVAGLLTFGALAAAGLVLGIIAVA